MNQGVNGSFIGGYESFSRRSESEIRSAISSGTIALDTNAIINLYRMDKEAREEYLSVLTKISERVWVPRQVADEFHKNRLSAVSSHISSLESKSKKVTEAAATLKEALKDFARLRSLADGRSREYLAPLDAAISEILSHVSNDVEGFDLNAGRLASSDPILERLEAIFNGRVGPILAEEDKRKAREEARRRGDLKIPPGYRDMEEKGEEGAGDYLIWNELINHAKSCKRSVVFISTDLKDDWIRHQAGLAIGARPELVEEMRSKAGVDYIHLSLAQFLKNAASALLVEVSQNTIAQVKHQAREEEVQARLWVDLHEKMAAVQSMDSRVDLAKSKVVDAQQHKLAILSNLHHLEEVLNTSEFSPKARKQAEQTLFDTRSELAAASEYEKECLHDLRFLEKRIRGLSRMAAEAERALADPGYRLPSSEVD